MDRTGWTRIGRKEKRANPVCACRVCGRRGGRGAGYRVGDREATSGKVISVIKDGLLRAVKATGLPSGGWRQRIRTKTKEEAWGGIRLLEQ